MNDERDDTQETPPKPDPDAPVWINGAIVAPEDARIGPTSAGLLYGWGVFTTLGLRGGRPLAFAHHWHRLTAHAERLRIGLDWTGEIVERELETLVARCGVIDGRARITVARGAAGPWQSGAGDASDVLMFAAAVAPREPKALALTVSPYRILSTSPLAGVKTTAYVGQLLALEEARARGFDEAIMLNERGEVAEATSANVFWVREGELYTPSLATGCLAGVARRLVLEAARAARVRVSEGGYALSELADADELFLTSSTRGVASAGELDIRRYPAAPVARRLAAGLEKLL